MNKIISILLVIVMLVSVMSVSAFAVEKDFSQFKYYDKIVEYFDEYYEDEIQYVYDEVYYHYSDDNTEEPDWSLIFCGFCPQPIEAKYGTLVGDRILSVVGGGCSGFVDGYGVYVRETDSFITLRQNTLEEICEQCPDFIKSIEENEIGQQFGDVDNDGELSVIDVTYIQRFLAQCYDFIQTYFVVSLDGGKDHIIVPDFDRDGTTTILDATAIQLKLAGLYGEPQYDDELVYVEYDRVFYPNTYPEKPEKCVALDYEVKVNSGYFGCSTKLGYPDTFMAIIKNKEQYEYIFEESRYINYDEEIFKTHWLVASMVYTTCGEGVAKIDTVDVFGDTLYVSVDEYIVVPDDEMLTDVMLPFVSLVAVEKEKLAYVTDVVRVE